MQLYVGCSDFPRDRKAFYKHATAIEYRVGLFTPPKPSILQGWAAEMSAVGVPTRSVWVAWQAFTHRVGDIRKGAKLKLLPGEDASRLGHFQKTDENMRVWTRIKEQAVHVGASRILLETTAGFTPSSANRRAMTEFVKDWAKLPSDMRLVWHPAGFWEREEAAAFAADLGMVLAIDPLVDEKEALPEDDEAYFQMLGRHGLLDNYSDDDLERILDAASCYEEATIVFRTYDSLGDARRLIDLSKCYEPSFDHYADWDDQDEDDFDAYDGDDDDFEDDDDQ